MGGTKTVAEWAEKMAVGRNLILERLKMGWSIEKTLSTPITTKNWSKSKKEKETKNQ